MPTILLHKKIFKKKMNNRGFSSVVGAVFMVLIMVTLASGFYTFTLSENTTYNQAIREKNQLEISRLNENIHLFDTAYTTFEGGVTVSVKIQNTGALDGQLITLWVYANEESSGWSNFNYSKISSLTIQGGESLPIQNFNVPIQGISMAGRYNYSSWFVTSRGNIVALPLPTMGIISAQIAQGIGSISMDFKSYRSYIVNASNYLGTPNPSFTFSRTTYTAFSIKVTNLDPSGMALNLTYNSMLWLFSPASGAIKGESWRIASVNNNIISTLTQNQFILLPYNQTSTLYFGPYAPGTNNLGAGIAAVNLILTGKIGSLDYGQNLPFISLIAT